jgi:hypothetical protein
LDGELGSVSLGGGQNRNCARRLEECSSMHKAGPPAIWTSRRFRSRSRTPFP